MFFANNVRGERTHISSAKSDDKYYCHACGNLMIQKHGNINAHHFAHKSCGCCDPWYTEKLSVWHAKMQSIFRKSAQEVVIWNPQHTEYHIADVALQAGKIKYVIEFQHSAISQDEFIIRSFFYMQCGYKLIWIFNFCECKKQKRILIAADGYEDNTVQLVWPGRDRIRFLDNIGLSNFSGQLYVVFHANTGKGKQVLHDPAGYHPWVTWEYIDPFHRKHCFLPVILDDFTDTTDFRAKYYSEEDFYTCLKRLNRNY